MIFCVTFLRAIAACIITNSHYTGIYPTDLIANGGLFGDIIFFAVSGFCLYNVKKSFVRWYGKRIYRIYVPVILMTFVFMLFGLIGLQKHNLFWWFIYPTNYHFIASIVFLYIPYYIFMKIDLFRKNIIKVILAVAAIWLVVYLVFYDKSYYHIDSVYEPMIRFLFMESMLLGAWFRQNYESLRNKFKWIFPTISILSFGFYFFSKTIFSSYQNLSAFQLINQILIFIPLFFLFRTFIGLDGKLEKLPATLKTIITFISNITLEIYLVQFVLIDAIRPIGHFPVNWVAITASIILCAWILHMVCKGVYYLVDVFTAKLKKLCKLGR